MTDYSKVHGFAPPHQQPPVGIDPQNIYRQPLQHYYPEPYQMEHVEKQQNKQPQQLVRSKSNNSHSEAQGTVYGAVYSGVPVYEMMCRDIAVMRRQKDSFLNATQVLKVANIDKGKRTKILEKEIQNGDHEKVQGGYGKYQGTWIPFERGVQLAEHYNVDGLLSPLLNYTPPNGRSDRTPTKEQVMGTQRPNNGSNYASKKNSQYGYPEKRVKIDRQQSPPENEREMHMPQYHLSESPMCESFFEFQDPKHQYVNPYASASFIYDYNMHYHMPMDPIQNSPIAVAASEPTAERHRSTLMALFINGGGAQQHDMLLPHAILPPDFDLDICLDDQGHSAIHWAAALANIPLLTLLIQKGAQVDKTNYAGESALVRAVMVTHNHERQVFLELLSLLKDNIFLIDHKGRTIFHHICLSSSIKGRPSTCMYYMQCLLEFMAKMAGEEAMSSDFVHSDSGNSLSRRILGLLNAVDLCGDTAINTAARLGCTPLYELLVEAGADTNIANYAGIRPADFLFELGKNQNIPTGYNPHNRSDTETTMIATNPRFNSSSTVTFPGILTENDTPFIPPTEEMSSGQLQTQVNELRNQIYLMSRELAQSRSEMKPLKAENAIIPELHSQIASLQKALSERAYVSQQNNSIATVPTSNVNESDALHAAQEEIHKLKAFQEQQKNVQAQLCEELRTLRSVAGPHEISCKKIIAACCNVPLEHVDELLQPLLDAVEADQFHLDMRLVVGFMSRIRRDTVAAVPPSDAQSESESSGNFLIGHSKQHKLELKKQQQVKWMAELRSEKNTPISNTSKPHSPIVEERVQTPAILADNWYQVSNNITTRPNTTQNSKCIESEIHKHGMNLPCPACSQPIVYHVHNLALEEILKNEEVDNQPKHSALEDQKRGLVSNQPDYDEDPKMLAERYKHQLDQLNNRISLFKDELLIIKKSKNEKSTDLLEKTSLVSNCTKEMKHLNQELERMQNRIIELNSIADEAQAHIPNLKSCIEDLTEKESVIESTLESLCERKDKIKELETKLNGLSATVEDNQSRTEAIIQHMKNIRSESTHTQGLYDAKNRQIETEEHLKQLAEREAGRMKLDMKRMGNEVSTISDQLNILQTNIYRGNERIEAVRAEFKLETEELNEWLRVQAEKQDDNQALLKYSKEDEAKAKELGLAIEKLMIQVNKRKATLDAEVTETQVAQIELENTTEEFKRLHQERQELIHQWEIAVSSMKQRDDDINNAQTNYRNQKEEIRRVQEKIKERQELYQNQLDQNAETEKNISLAERKVAKFREEESENNQNLQQFKDEVEVLKNTLNKSATDLVNRRSELNNLKANLKERQEKLDKGERNYEEMLKRMANLDDETVSLEARAEQLQDILNREKAKDKELDKQIKQLREAQFKQSQNLFKLRQEEKNLQAEIVGGEAANRNLKSKIHKLDHDTLKQRAMLYSMEFGIQQLERKIRRMEGDRTDEEKNELLSKIQLLNTKLEEETNKYNMLNVQLKKSQEDLRHSRRQLETLEKTRNDIATNIRELNLYNESASHQLAVKIKEKENLMVEENILRLELRRLRSYLHARSDEVFTLESRQVQLRLALEERGKEIDIHKEMVKVQIKNAEEERHSAAAELRDRVGKVEKLKKRYEILMTQFAPEEGEEEHSQAYYVIKAAQKREELQREGDELDANIRRAEKEIKALENTLKMMNNRNEQYRNNLFKAELDSKDVQHKEMLDAEYSQVMDSFKKKRAEIQDLQLTLQEVESRYNMNTQQEAGKLQEVQVMEAKCEAVKAEIEEQGKKRNRAVQFIRKASKLLRKEQQRGTITHEEQDFLIRALKDIGTIALNDLKRFAEKNPEVAEKLQSLMSIHNLQPPSRTVSRVSSRASSVMGENPVEVSRVSSRSNSRIHSVSNSRSNSRHGSVHSNEQNIEEPQETSSRASSRVGSEIDPGETEKPPLMSTTNLNASIDFTHAGERGGAASSKSTPGKSSKPTSKSAAEKPERGPITGSGRIKQTTRPGSAGSNSSRGSRVSSK
ncbi:Coiled-coil domain-containing protein 39 [Boothiomyces sp. JEL0866]|nr:Coiled-coil domain-containing protein 39 [Boothiomyces sp. JEL0866]